MSIADKFEVFVFDLHNTIYDEVIEYGLAMDAAISSLPVNREKIYEELTLAHGKLGSDWDDDVWKMLPSLKSIDDNVINNAIKLRREKSEELTLKGIYPQAAETLQKLKTLGKKIYIVTEAAADVGMQALEWLGLSGIIDGIYTYPSRKQGLKLSVGFHKIFPKDGDSHLKKPDPRLLEQVAKDAGVDKSQMLYIGDSKFKDGVMARDAGVKFAWAEYGKIVKNPEVYKKAEAILYAVTGWDKDTLKLTQDSSRDVAIDALQPDYILKESLKELL